MATILDLDFKVTGIEAVLEKVGRLDTMSYLQPPMQRGLYRLLSKMASYPSAPSGSKYRRTGTYGRKWTTNIKQSSTSLQGKIGINLSYAPWVGSGKFQSKTHAKNGWMTDKKAVESLRQVILDDFNNAIRRHIK